MVTLELTQCNRQLEFELGETWPKALPACSWREYLLCGFARSSGTVIDLQSLGNTFLESLLALYPHLSFVDLSALFLKARHLENELNFSKADLFHAYGLRYTENLEILGELVAKTPLSFQAWARERDLSAADFAFLKMLKNVHSLEAAFSKIVELKVSRNTAVQILELEAELESLAKVTDASYENAETWLSELQQMRYPQTSQRDEERKKSFQKVRLPHNIKSNWKRVGDSGHLELKLTVSGEVELKKTLAGLQKFEGDLAQAFQIEGSVD